MRVKGTLKVLCIALLASLLLMPVAGAIYIPGQTYPDDVTPHILLAGDQAGGAKTQEPGTMHNDVASGPTKKYLSEYPGQYVLIPGNDPNMMYALGGTSGSGTIPSGSFAGFPAFISQPSLPASSYSIPPLSSASSPATINTPIRNSNGDMVIGNVVGHIVPPMTPGYWDNVDPKSLKTNMPVLNAPCIFA